MTTNLCLSSISTPELRRKAPNRHQYAKPILYIGSIVFTIGAYPTSLHVWQGAALLEMRLASSHGASSRVISSTWLRPRHRARFATAGLNPVTRKSFEKLQLDLDEEPYVPRGEVNPNANNIAVLGGGITGLTTAFELSRILPDAKITVYEKAKRLGGWMDSEIIPVGDGEVVFEWGPRTLRHTGDGSGVATVNLVCFYTRLASRADRDTLLRWLIWGWGPKL